FPDEGEQATPDMVALEWYIPTGSAETDAARVEQFQDLVVWAHERGFEAHYWVGRYSGSTSFPDKLQVTHDLADAVLIWAPTPWTHWADIHPEVQEITRYAGVDINNDGVVNAVDVQLVQNAALMTDEDTPFPIYPYSGD